MIVRTAIALAALAAILAPSADPASATWYSGTITFRAAETSNVTVLLTRSTSACAARSRGTIGSPRRACRSRSRSR